MTDLPNGWEYKTLGEVAKWGSGGTPRAGTLSYYDGEIPWAIIGDLNDSYVSQTARNITKKGLEESSAKMVPVGAVLIAMYGSIGKLGINTIPMATNQAIAFAIPKIDLVLQKYLFYYLRSQREVFLWSGKGATQQNISQTLLKAWKIPLPPIPEQQEIVEILEDHLTRLDAALADVKQAKVKAAQFRRSLFRAAFTGNLIGDGAGLMTDLPNGWEIMRLDEIADVVMGQSPPGSSYNENGEGRPFFQGKTEFGEVHPTVRKYTTAGTKFAKAGDILMSVRAPVGPTNIADIDCVIGRGLAAIRAKTVVSQNYLRWSLKHLEIDIQSKGTGTTFDAITGETLRGTLIALPPLPEQQKIVEIIEDHLSRLDASVAIADAMEKQSFSLRRSLLQAAFSGQLTKEVASV